MKYRFGTVVWLDAHGNMEQTNMPDALKEYGRAVRVETRGWIARNKRGVLLAYEKMPDGEYRTFTFIPNGMVKSIKYRDGGQ